MKKTLIALAAIGAMTGVAHAQSSVTLYGLVDVWAGQIKTNTATVAATPAVVGPPAVAATFGKVESLKQTKIDPAGFNGSRWGMRIREDLGGGMAAIANLESGFNADTGASAQGGLLFGRRANVGLTGGFGTITLGRNSSSYDDVSIDNAMMLQSIFDPSQTNNGPSTAAAGGVLASAANAATFLGRNTSWIGFNTRFNNSVKYISPDFGGFTGSLMYALGEDKTAAIGASSSVSANLKYANGPLVVSGGYQSEGAARTATLKPALENALLSVAYDFGVVKLGAGFNRAKFKDVAAPAVLGGGNFKAQNEYNLSVSVPVGAAVISAGYAQSKGDTLGKSSGYGLQATYALSKRTFLYTGVGSTKAYDKLAAAVAANGSGSVIGKTQTAAVGVQHRF
jgi:predicted porin